MFVEQKKSLGLSTVCHGMDISIGFVPKKISFGKLNWAMNQTVTENEKERKIF